MPMVMWEAKEDKRVRAFVEEQDRRFQKRLADVHPNLKTPAAERTATRNVRLPPPPPRAALPIAAPRTLKSVDAGLSRILAEVSAARRLSLDDLCSHKRDASIVAGRDAVFYRMHDELGLYFTEIGRWIDLDRTAVSAAVERHHARLPKRQQ